MNYGCPNRSIVILSLQRPIISNFYTEWYFNRLLMFRQVTVAALLCYLKLCSSLDCNHKQFIHVIFTA